MNRKELLETLELVKPALATENSFQLFNKFCFENGIVFANKDTLAIVTKCEVQGTFGVEGKTLINMLNAMSGADVDINIDKENVNVKSGRSKMKLPYIPKSDFVFDIPENENWEVMMDVSKELCRAIELCLVTSAYDVTMNAFNGVWLKGPDNNVKLYTCDSDALSRYTIGKGVASEGPFVIPNEFCEAILRICAKTERYEGQLYINHEWCVAELANGYHVFGRTIEPSEDFRHEEFVRQALDAKPEFFEIPDEFIPALERAKIISENDGSATNVTVSDGKLTMFTSTSNGELKDQMILKGHPDVDVNVSAKTLINSVKVCNEFSLLENSSVFRNGTDFLIVIGHYEG